MNRPSGRALENAHDGVFEEGPVFLLASPELVLGLLLSVTSRAVKTTPAERSPGSMGVELRYTLIRRPSLRRHTVTMLPVPLCGSRRTCAVPTRSNSSSLLYRIRALCPELFRRVARHAADLLVGPAQDAVSDDANAHRGGLVNAPQKGFVLHESRLGLFLVRDVENEGLDGNGAVSCGTGASGGVGVPAHVPLALDLLPESLVPAARARPCTRDSAPRGRERP